MCHQPVKPGRGRRFPSRRFPNRPREIEPVQPLPATPAPLLPLFEGDFPEDDQWPDQ
jgi:hypothetical protein